MDLGTRETRTKAEDSDKVGIPVPPYIKWRCATCAIVRPHVIVNPEDLKREGEKAIYSCLSCTNATTIATPFFGMLAGCEIKE